MNEDSLISAILQGLPADGADPGQTELVRRMEARGVTAAQLRGAGSFALIEHALQAAGCDESFAGFVRARCYQTPGLFREAMYVAADCCRGQRANPGGWIRAELKRRGYTVGRAGAGS